MILDAMLFASSGSTLPSVQAGPGSVSIDDLDLSVRSNNCLRRAGINTVDELVQKTEEDMMKVRNLGRKASPKSANFFLTSSRDLRPKLRRIRRGSETNGIQKTGP